MLFQLIYCLLSSKWMIEFFLCSLCYGLLNYLVSVQRQWKDRILRGFRTNSWWLGWWSRRNQSSSLMKHARTSVSDADSLKYQAFAHALHGQCEFRFADSGSGFAPPLTILQHLRVGLMNIINRVNWLNNYNIIICC